MRVLLISSLPRGGPVEQTLVLARGLARQGHDIHVVCATAQIAARGAREGLSTSVVALRTSLDWRNAGAIVRRAAKADVVHAQDRRSGLWLALSPRPRREAALVHTIHGLPDPYLPPPAGPASPGLRAVLAYRMLQPQLARRLDGLIVPSHAIADALAARLGLPRERLTVIPNGVAPRDAVATGTLVGTLSTLHRVKGLDVFLAAAARLAAERPRLRFAIFGAGPEEERLATLAGELGIADRVIRPGHVPASDALAQLAVFVLCSHMENSPMSLLEAMAAGVPVVTTRVGGIPEIATDDCAQLVAPGDPDALAGAIGRLLDDRTLCERQAGAARARVRRLFTEAGNARATAELYRRLLELRSSAAQLR